MLCVQISLVQLSNVSRALAPTRHTQSKLIKARIRRDGICRKLGQHLKQYWHNVVRSIITAFSCFI